MSANLPSRDDFAACLHTRFRVTLETGAPLALELVTVSEMQTSAWQQSFSIVFQGPAARLIPQHIYKLVHEKLGELDLFLVPIGQQGDAILYEAVFNHLLEKK